MLSYTFYLPLPENVTNVRREQQFNAFDTICNVFPIMSPFFCFSLKTFSFVLRDYRTS